MCLRISGENMKGLLLQYKSAVGGGEIWLVGSMQTSSFLLKAQMLQ